MQTYNFMFSKRILFLWHIEWIPRPLFVPECTTFSSTQLTQALSTQTEAHQTNPHQSMPDPETHPILLNTTPHQSISQYKQGISKA